MERLKVPLRNRGLNYTREANGSVTVNGNNFSRESDVEDYLATIRRKDLPDNVVRMKR
jgi:hypothetical protein